MSETRRISIVVACRNEAAHIGAFLDSLLGQDMTGIEWEAIAADGMSEDGTRAILSSYCARHPQLRTIDNTGRIVPTGLNAAIHVANGDIILRMDAHTRYAPDYCRRCVETLERTGADNVGGPARTIAHGTAARAIAAAYHSRFSTGGARFHDESYAGWVDTVPYGCWRRETLDRIGLFDETLVRNQDDELNLRLLRNGGKIWQNPEIVSWYLPRPTLKALFRQYFQYGFWKVAVIRKHRLPGSWRHLAPACFLLGNAVLLAGACGGSRICALLIAAAVTCYGATAAVASAVAARNSGWATLPYLPAAFAAYHLSYALGFMAGLLQQFCGRGRPLWQAAAFTRITR